MKRLTKYSDFAKCYLPFSLTNWDFDDGKIINRLGKLEDVLEKHNVESIEELDLILQGLKIIHQENANLKNELIELKQNAIVPQFKPNDDAYIIWNGTIIDVKISSIVTINEYIVKTCHSDLQHDGKACIDENEVFATREEAEQTLAEIRGKDE